MINQPIITLDIDWAPDFIVEYVSGILSKKNVKATWFITHESTLWEQLRKNKLFELGIHPNFLSNSTHGDNPDAILSYLKKIVPEAKSVRTHSLAQSSQILLKFQKYGIENDVSLHLEKTPFLSPHYSKFLNLFRFPFFWGDGNEMVESTPNWSMNNPSYNVDGMKIFYFHPIHIYLNSKNWDNYERMKKTLDLSKLNKENIQNFVNRNEEGTGVLFENITSFLKGKQTYTITDLQKLYFKFQ